MAHSLPPLPYDFAALEPHIDAQTMQIHHGKHHQAYINNLNNALSKHPELADKDLEDLLRNLSGALADGIRKTFGDFTKFKEQLTAAATGHFGSGWGWLTVANGKLEIGGRPNQDSPLMDKKVPILGVDVWEHAYYLKYQNRSE